MIAKGRPGLYLLMFVIQSALTFVGCLVAVRWSPEAIALSMVATMAIFAIFTFVVPMKIIKINVPALLKTFAFPGLLSLFMLAVVALTRHCIAKVFPPLITVLVCVIVGVISYALAALLIRPDLVNLIWEMVATTLLPRTPRGRVVSTVPAGHDEIVE
jgi:hypothetical protein